MAGAHSTAELEDGKQTSAGIMIAVNKEVASVVDTTGGKVESFEEHEGELSEGWTARNEASREAVI